MTSTICRGWPRPTRRERRRESERAERIIYEEREHFDGWLVALQAVPTIRDLRRRAESIRQTEVERFFGRLRLDPGQEEVMAQHLRAQEAHQVHFFTDRADLPVQVFQALVVAPARRVLQDHAMSGAGEDELGATWPGRVAQAGLALHEDQIRVAVLRRRTGAPAPVLRTRSRWEWHQR